MGQFDSDLLGPSEIETWDTLMGAQDPNWNQPAPAPYVEPAADQMYAPAPELSYAAPYETPVQNYGTDASGYAPEMAYGGPAEPAYVDPFMAGDATQQYQDPFMQQAYAPAPYVDNSGAIPPGSLDSWESPSNFTENETFSTVNGEDIGGRSTPGTAPASTPGFFESRNPQFAQSNAQFDATANPENRGGPGILGGAINLGAAAVGPIPQLVDLANTAGEAVARNRSLSNTFTAPTLGAGTGQIYGGQESLTQPLADLLLPQTPLDIALTVAPGLGLFDDAGKTALRGYGQNLDTFRKAAGQIDELPLGAAYAALDNPLQNPALAPDVTDLMVGNRPRSIAGAADDVGDTPFAAAKKTLQDQFAGMNKGEIRATLEGAGFGDEIVTNKNGVLNTDKTYDAVARKVAGEGPTPRVAPVADMAGTVDDALKAAPAPGEKFPTGTVRSAANDPVDVAELARVTDYGPAPTEGVQQGFPGMPKAIDTRSSWEKFADEAAAAAGAPRSVLASFDLSAPGRQGLALAFRHPREWIDSWAPMIRAWADEGAATAIERDLNRVANSWKAKTGGDDLIHLYQTGAEAGGLERVPGFETAGKGVISGLIRKIPGIEKSERAYATFLNSQKVKTFDTMARALEKAGEKNPEVFKGLGRVIDHATGYGAAPLKGRIEGQTFFSQRYMTSRFQFLTDPIVEALVKRDMNAARAATENLVAFTGGLGGILALLDASGTANVEWDPRSTDFGKIRVGPQRIDFGAGFLPLIRTLAREVTGEGKTATGAVYDTNRITEGLKFLRNKLAPIPSEAVSRAMGEDPVGKPNPPILSFNTIANMFAPLIAQSTVEAFKETGSPFAAARAATSELFGGGTTTYGSGQAQQIDIAKQEYGTEYDNLYSAQQAEINARIAAETDLPYRNRQAPWWQARDDGLQFWSSQIEADVLNDPMSQAALSFAGSGYMELAPQLVKWNEETYGLPRDEAEAGVEKFLTSTGLTDIIKAYREDVLSADPGFAKSWLDAYNNYERDVYEPPKWIKDIAKGK